MSSAATFAAVAVGLLIAHTVADHWVQTGHQAATKGQRDNAGRRACALHVAGLLGKTQFYVLGQPRGFSVPIDRVERHDLPEGGHALSLVTDDVPLDNPSLGTGAYALDQSWHWGWLGVAAFLTAVL